MTAPAADPVDRSTLAAMDVAGRAARLVDRLGAAEVDGLLVTDLTNVRYLTGFTGSAALLVVTPGGLTFVTDGRYGQQAAEQLGAAGVAAAALLARLRRPALAAAPAGMPEVADGLGRTG